MKPTHVRVAEVLGWTNLRQREEDGIWGGKGPDVPWDWSSPPRYDIDWSATGPLIEQLAIHLDPDAPSTGTEGWAWRAYFDDTEVSWGQTPLLAVCQLILDGAARKGRERAQNAVCRGWRPLVGRLYDSLLAAGWDGRLIQVKEKFGGLRFYVERETPELRKLINAAMTESMKTCEVCGAVGEGNVRESGWRNTLCAIHAADPRPAWKQARDLHQVSPFGVEGCGTCYDSSLLRAAGGSEDVGSVKGKDEQ